MTAIDRYQAAMNTGDIPAAQEVIGEIAEACYAAIDCQWPTGWGFYGVDYNNRVLHLFYLRAEPKLTIAQIDSILELGITDFEFHNHRWTISGDGKTLEHQELPGS